MLRLTEAFFKRRIQEKTATSSSDDLEKTINLISRDNILIHTLDPAGQPLLEEARRVLRNFGQSITIVSMQSISLFNSSLNDRAQLVFSTHDVSLLDTKALFRKEQIWFTDKDDDQVYLYSLV